MRFGRPLILAGLLLVPFPQAGANVFGDGDPGNGVEDDRRSLHEPTRGGIFDYWRDSAGTIFCEGEIRGSAMILDVSQFADEAPGMFLVTAAHVMMDLDSGRNFADCEFQYLALGHVPGYQFAIDPGWVRTGPFDPRADPGLPRFGREDWAFVYLPDGFLGSVRSSGIRPLAFGDLQAHGGDVPTFLLVAWDRASREMGVSPGCSVLPSRPGDLGGGAWPGQLLDDCDSGDGASGGGLVVSLGRNHFLVGIRSGSHWSPDAYPAAQYPDGPPPGARWDVRHNTNFARAIDADLLNALGDLVVEATLDGGIARNRAVKH